MSMSKKDYEMVASVLNDVARQAGFESKEARGVGLVILALSARFESDNPRFQARLFEQTALLNKDDAVCTACKRRKWSTFCTVTDDGRHP